MNILIANWKWDEGGGDWTYIKNIIELYTKKGHHIIPFSTKDGRNGPSAFSEYYVERLDYESISKKKTLKNSYDVLCRSIYSKDSRSKIFQLLRKNRVDLAHLNNIHNHLTPSIIPVLKKKNVPIIWTLHDYKIMCPNATLYNKSGLCEKCQAHNYLFCLFNRCKRNSYSASLVAALESYLFSFMNIYRYVDVFICPSDIVCDKVAESGIPRHKIVKIPHLYDSAEIDEIYFGTTEEDPSASYILFLGRLEPNKGVLTLLRAMKMLPDIRLLIAGTGSQEKELIDYIRLHNLDNVEVLGSLSKPEALKKIRMAKIIVCPSEWLEVFGYVITESMMMGKPVIASNIGAIPELIVDEVTGILFKPGDDQQLAQKIRWVFSDTALRKKIGQNARTHAKGISDMETYYKALTAIFSSLGLKATDI